jgi:hypothetical protein
LADKEGAAAGVEIWFGQRQRLPNPEPGSPEHDNQGAEPEPVVGTARLAHHGDDLLDPRRIGRVAEALVAWWATGLEATQGGR